jgi:hypothetical protein
MNTLTDEREREAIDAKNTNTKLADAAANTRMGTASQDSGP